MWVSLEVMGGGERADLFYGYPTGLRDQEEREEDSNELPGSKKDVDAPLERAQHIQEGCRPSNTVKSATNSTTKDNRNACFPCKLLHQTVGHGIGRQLNATHCPPILASKH